MALILMKYCVNILHYIVRISCSSPTNRACLSPGYVLLINNLVPYFHLDKLGIIRGAHLFNESYSLFVAYNWDKGDVDNRIGLKELRFNNLVGNLFTSLVVTLSPVSCVKYLPVSW